MADQSGMFLNHVLSMLLKKIIVPSDFHHQSEVVKEVQIDDISGFVDSLTDLAVESASVDFTIETDNDNFTKVLKKWLDLINISYIGKIPSGINALAQEYYKERWKCSSFPILKISKWETVDQLILPTKMYFLDGGSVYAFDKDNGDKNNTISLLNYNYYLGKNKKVKLDNNVIFSKPYGRWFDKYPIPFLIKRGIYHNWKIIESIKKKETEILDQIIPYMMLIKKGTENLAVQNVKTYSDEELKAVVKQMQDLITEMKSTNVSNDRQLKSPVRATQFDEELKHLIPDISTMFKEELFAVIEKQILSGFGFMAMSESLVNSRKDAILNPKGFITECKAGVKGFKQILEELVKIIKIKNSGHIKYISNRVDVISSPITTFMTEKFKDQLRQAFDRGKLSAQTYIELVPELDFETEVRRREKEAQRGIEHTLYPNLIRNDEAKGTDIPSTKIENNLDKNDNEIPDNKVNEVEKKEFDLGNISKKNLDSLEIAPYTDIKDLPNSIQNNMDKDLQNIFKNVFNNVFEQFKNETRAFRAAWSVIKRLARKNSKGIWVRKKKRIEGKLQKIKLDRELLENALAETEKEIISEVFSAKKLEIAEKQSKLLSKLLDEKDNKI